MPLIASNGLIVAASVNTFMILSTWLLIVLMCWPLPAGTRAKVMSTCLIAGTAAWCVIVVYMYGS